MVRICTDKILKPTDISGLVAWFDMQDTGAYSQSAGTMVSVTNKVSATVWNTALNSMPTYSATGINGLPAMIFDGSTQGIASTEAALVTAFTNTPTRTCYAVASADVADDLSVIFGFGNSGQATASSGGFGLQTTAAGVKAMFHRNAADTQNNDESSSASNTNPNIWTVLNSTTTVSIKINNASADPNAAGAVYGTTTPNRCAIGCIPRSTKAVEWDGNIGEILIYTTEHDTATQNLITAYLGSKWGIAVS